MNADKALGTFTAYAVLPQLVAGDTDRAHLIFKAPRNVTITKVECHFPIAVTGHATAFVNLNVGTVASSTSSATQVALGSIDTDTGTANNRAAGAIVDFGITATALPEGDFLTVETEIGTTGLVLGKPSFIVTYRNT